MKTDIGVDVGNNRTKEMIVMDLRYIVKNFNPTPRKQEVDTVPVVKQEEIEDIRQGIRCIMDLLSEHQSEMPPDYMNACELDDKQLTEVRSYLLKVWEEYFPGYELSKEMNQLFIWNIPNYIYKAAQYCSLKMYPDALNPLFWFIMYCIDFKDPDDYCRLILRTIESMTNDPEVSLIADELMDGNTSENNGGED